MVNFGLGGNSVSAIPMAQMLMNPATCLLSPQASYRIIHIPTPTPRRFTLHSLYDAASSPILHKTSEEYSSSVGSPTLHLSRWNPHINLIASAVAVSATCLFLSAIPALLAFKRAAESLEKLMDVTREELPDTMSAIRLSGMEISDLTMELSDLGQGITQGVKNSTQAVRVAEQRLRQFSTKDPSASLQRITSPKTEVEGPALARKARSMREGIVKGRAIFQLFSTLTGFSRMLLNYFAKKRAKQ